MATKPQLEAIVKQNEQLMRGIRHENAKLHQKIYDLEKLLEGKGGDEGFERSEDESYTIVKGFYNEKETWDRSIVELDEAKLKAARIRPRARKNAFLDTLLSTCALLLHDRDVARKAFEGVKDKLEKVETQLEEKQNELDSSPDFLSEVLELKTIVEKVLPIENPEESVDLFDLRRYIEDLEVAYSKKD